MHPVNPPRRWWPLFAVLVAWAALSAAPSARAQAYPCPGPGPGERMVGMTPGGDGVAPVPLFVRDDDGGYDDEPAAPQAPVRDYAAVAWHPDAADVWFEGGYSDAGAAEREARAACNAVMGGGCTTTGEWWNSSMVIIRDRVGYFYNAWLDKDRSERDKVLADCSAQQLLPCEIYMTFNSSRRQYRPGAEARKIYGAGAWVHGNEGYDGKLYLATGYRDSKVAVDTAVKACSDANPGRTCEMVALSGNGIIQTFRYNGNFDNATVETTPRRAREAAKRLCAQLKASSCVLQAAFDSRTPGVFVHEFAAASTGK